MLELGITLGVENLYNGLGGHMLEGPCSNACKMAERIDCINEPYGCEGRGVCVDTGHVCIGSILC